MYKPGDLVMAINVEEKEEMTNGKRYKFVKHSYELSDDYFSVIANDGEEHTYYAWRFEPYKQYQWRTEIEDIANG